MAHRVVIALGWLLVALLLVPQVRLAGDRLTASGAGAGSTEADRVDRALATRFGSASSSQAVLVVRGLPSADTPAGAAVLQRLVAAVDSIPGVAHTFSYLSGGDRAFLSARGTFLVASLSPSAGPSDDVVAVLRARTAALARARAPTYPALTLLWTGGPAIDLDIKLTSAADAAAAERRIAPLALLLLLIVFGSVGAALLPVVVAALAILLAIGAAVVIARFYPLSVLLQNIVSMLGLGVGVDYALLTVSRFREGLRAGLNVRRATAETVRHAGHTVLLSGTAVMIGFAALLVIPASELRSVATGGLLVVGLAALLASTLLPALLSWLGTRVDWVQLRRAPVASAPGNDRWRRWGQAVATRPLLVLVVGAAPMFALAWEGRRFDAGQANLESLSERMESRQGLDALRAMGKSGVVETVQLLVELPAGTGALTERGWSAVARLSDAASTDPRLARVLSLPSLTHAARPSASLLTFLPAQLFVHYVSRDERAALIELVPRESVSPRTLMRLVRELRARDAGVASGLPGTTVHVGGLSAADVDSQDAIGGNFATVVAIVIGGTMLALVLGFRSLLIPLKAVALNLLSVGAAFGAAVLVFQDGHGIQWFGLTHPSSGMPPAVPVIVFCIVFGLSMDYEVFLVSRVAEAHRQGLDDLAAVADGVARTGGVITSAAIVMIVVFVAFALGDFLIVKVLGFTLAVAVLLDATVVRMAIGPALLRLAGPWNWWPGERGGPSPADAEPLATVARR